MGGKPSSLQMNIEGRKQRDRHQVQSLGLLTHHQPHPPRHLASAAAPSPAQRTTAAGRGWKGGTAAAQEKRTLGGRAGRAGAGAVSGHHDFSGQRWWGWSTPSRGRCTHGRGDEHSSSRQTPSSGAVPSHPPSRPSGQKALCLEGGRVGRAGAWGPARSTRPTGPVALAPSPGRL